MFSDISMENKRKIPGDIDYGPSKHKRDSQVSLNSELLECVHKVNECWINNSGIDTGNLQLSIFPFKHCIVERLVQDESYLKELKKELVEIEFVMKRNDLYQFHQSLDLSTVDKPQINSLRKFLLEECRPWLENMTGIPLNGKISTTCSSYSFTDHLLCHDDKCEDRRIAFILYLSENWEPEFGGSLELFNTNEFGQPNIPVTEIWPKFNSFVFFEVTNNSFHQVTEVLSLDFARVTVNGWFHGPLSANIPVNTMEDLPRFPPLLIDTSLFSLVNEMYLNPTAQEQICSRFEEESEMLLPNFLQNSFYEEICKCLENDDLSWELQGPVNRRKYETLSMETVPFPLQQLLQLFRSEVFFKLLNSLTNLDLTIQENVYPHCSYEVQRWRGGFYTLLRDSDRNDFALDVMLYCNAEDLENLQGGFTSYIARNADEELLTLTPTPNSLALVFRDKETLRFVKYISQTFNSSFNLLSFVYYERESSTSEDKAPRFGGNNLSESSDQTVLQLLQ